MSGEGQWAGKGVGDGWVGGGKWVGGRRIHSLAEETTLSLLERGSDSSLTCGDRSRSRLRDKCYAMHFFWVVSTTKLGDRPYEND